MTERTWKQDELTVNVYETRERMGEAAARDVKARLLALMEEQETVRMIFAAAPSQNEVLAALAKDREIP